MTGPSSIVRAMEWMGIRWLSVGIARVFNQPHLPKLTPSPQLQDWSKEQILEAQKTSKYFAIGNAVRFADATPVVIGLYLARSPVVMVMMAVLMVLHAVLTLVESYRLALIKALLPFAESRPDNTQDDSFTSVQPSRYFTPRPFETLRFYRLLGMEWAQGRVVWYDGITRRSATEIESQAPVRYVEAPNLPGLVKFEALTRSAESSHLVLLIPNLLATVILLSRLSFYCLFSAVAVWFDLTLVLLQRYNRVRVMQVIRVLERRANRTARKPS